MSIHDKRIVFEKNGDPTVWPEDHPLAGQLKWPDGSIVILIPVEPIKPNAAETEPAYFLRVAAKANVAHAVQVAVVDKTALPFANPSDDAVVEYHVLDENTETVSIVSVSDKIRAFRTCWRWNGSAVTVDAVLEDARRWAKIRSIRNILLNLTDGPMAREREQAGPGKAALEAHRQELRDLPATQAGDPKAVIFPVKP